MKYISLVFFALLFAGCDRSQGDIEFTGTAIGIGNLVIKDQANATLYRADIDAGKVKINKQFLKNSGFYKMDFSLSGGQSRDVDIYLEPGAYTVNIDAKTINNYPVITSSSKIQNQLSAYNALADSVKTAQRKKVVAYNSQIHGLKDKLLRPGEYTVMVDKLQGQEMAANQVDALDIFKTFMKKYPDNEIAAHLMLAMDYQNDPVAYYNLFEKFSSAAKNSDDGKELESKLKPLTKLSAGAAAPVIAGTTPAGKKPDLKAMNKKIILIDLWRSSNGSSRENHQQMITSLLPEFGSKGFGIISVSFDTDKDKWAAAIDRDKMTWPQVSDLKGDDSPNTESWGIKSIPAYYLLDGQGRIITRVAEYYDVYPAISSYLKTH